MTMTFAEAYRALEVARAAADKASDALAVFPKGPLGLTPDSVKASEEFQTARRAYAVEAAKVKRLSGALVKADKVAMRALAKRGRRPLSAAEKKALERVGLAG